MNDALVAVAVLAVVALAVAMTALHYTRAQSILEHWAEENGYEILSSERRWFGGTFWWRKSKGQEVYYVTVRSRDGRTRQGWVRCGGWFLGVLSDEADVEWDD